MSDDERIQRLTELARRVWPDQGAAVSWDPFYDVAKVVNDRRTILFEMQSPHALDALEAALLVAHAAQAWRECEDRAQLHLVDLRSRLQALAEHYEYQGRYDAEHPLPGVMTYRDVALMLRTLLESKAAR